MKQFFNLLLVLFATGAAYAEECVYRDPSVCVFLHSNNNSNNYTYPEDKVPDTVVFENLSLPHLPTAFVQAHEGKLRKLNVSNGALEVLVILPGLEFLWAGNNQISGIATIDEEACSNLTFLDLSFNDLWSIKGLENCHNLQILNLNGNQELWSEGILDVARFRPHSRLVELCLAYNKILTVINSRQDLTFPNLKMLDLSTNNIDGESLDTKTVLAPFSNVTTLHLEDNRLMKIDYLPITEFKKLKVIFLNGNDLKCDTVEKMLNAFESKQIQVEMFSHMGCHSHFLLLRGMCCMPARKRRSVEEITEATTTDDLIITTERLTFPRDAERDETGTTYIYYEDYDMPATTEGRNRFRRSADDDIETIHSVTLELPKNLTQSEVDEMVTAAHNFIKSYKKSNYLSPVVEDRPRLGDVAEAVAYLTNMCQMLPLHNVTEVQFKTANGTSGSYRTLTPFYNFPQYQKMLKEEIEKMKNTTVQD